MDANFTYVQPGFNRLSPETFRIIDIPEPGTYFLSVIAEDNPKPWNTSIRVIPQIPVMGPARQFVKGPESGPDFRVFFLYEKNSPSTHSKRTCPY